MKSLQQRTAALMVILAVGVSGCAHVISSDLRARADAALTFSEVLKNPDAHQGKIVVWGGEIVKTENQKDGTTLVEVLQRPLYGNDEPEAAEPSAGRFLVRANQFLDPRIYDKDREITVAGEILGSRTRLLGEMQYQYPLIQSEELHLWDARYPAYPSPYYYPYYPRPYYYYDPWWDYPPYYYSYPYYYNRGHHEERNEGRGFRGFRGRRR
jgi:outer membrane lipoprotein